MQLRSEGLLFIYLLFFFFFWGGGGLLFTKGPSKEKISGAYYKGLLCHDDIISYKLSSVFDVKIATFKLKEVIVQIKH